MNKACVLLLRRRMRGEVTREKDPLAHENLKPVIKI